MLIASIRHSAADLRHWATLERGDVVAPQHRGPVVEQAITELVPGFDEHRPRRPVADARDLEA